MLRLPLLLTLVLALAMALVRVEAELTFSVQPPVEPPYLGEFCIDPATDGDLVNCYYLDPRIDFEAKRQFGL